MDMLRTGGGSCAATGERGCTWGNSPTCPGCPSFTGLGMGAGVAVSNCAAACRQVYKAHLLPYIHLADSIWKPSRPLHRPTGAQLQGQARENRRLTTQITKCIHQCIKAGVGKVTCCAWGMAAAVSGSMAPVSMSGATKGFDGGTRNSSMVCAKKQTLRLHLGPSLHSWLRYLHTCSSLSAHEAVHRLLQSASLLHPRAHA